MKIFKIQFLVTGATIILLSLLTLFNGCKKDFNNSDKTLTLESKIGHLKKEVLSEYNQKLLDKFLQNSKQYFVQSNLSSRTVADMLMFTNDFAFDAYNNSLNELSNQWDASNGVQIPQGDDFILTPNPGIPAYNAVDYALGFESTRFDYAYRSLQNGSVDFASGEAEVTDPYFQRTMNLNQEVTIGEYVYKQLDDGVLAKIPSSDYAGLNLVREYGITAPVQMELLDEIDGNIIESSPLGTRGACDMIVLADQLGTSTDVKATTRLRVVNGPACGGIFRYNFGDGTSDKDITEGGFTHSYNVPPGTSKTFTITVKYLGGVPNTPCAGCNGITSSVVIQVTNFGECHVKERHEKSKTVEFSASSGANTFPARLRTNFGFRGKVQGSFITTARPKIWLNYCFEIFKNGSWCSSRAGAPIVLSTNGFLQTDECSFNRPTNFSQSSQSSSNELLKTDNTDNGQNVPSIFGVIETNRNISLWGKIEFGPILHNRPFWEWDM